MSEVPVVIQSFKGLNLREPPGMIQDDELVSCKNLNIGRAGELVKRTGFEEISGIENFGSEENKDVNLLAYFRTPSESQIFVSTSENLLFKTEDSITWEAISKDVEEYAYNDLLTSLSLAPADVTSLGIEELIWFNASLGCSDGLIYPAVDTPGYRILFQNSNTLEYYYYTGEEGRLPKRCLNPTWNETDFTATPGLVLFGKVDFNFRYAVQYLNKLYIVTAGGIYTWDGTDLELIPDTPSGTFCIVYKDRLFVLDNKGTASNRNRIYFSAVADFTDWPSTNFFDVRPGDGDVLTSCAVIQDLLVIFKTSSTWALYVQGAPQNWVVRNINPEIGNLSKNTPKEIEGFLYFAGLRGIYRTDGNIFEELSGSIQPLFTQRNITSDYIDKDAAAWWDDRYIVLIYLTPTTYKYMVYHLRTEGWTEWVLSSGVIPFSFLEIVAGEVPKGLYVGSRNSLGNVLRYGSDIYLDNGQQYEIEMQSKDYDFGLPSLMKRGKWIGLDTLIEDSDGEVIYDVDGETLEELTFTGRTLRGLYKLKGPGYFRVWNFKYTSTSNKPLIFYSLTLWMHRKRSTIKAVT